MPDPGSSQFRVGARIAGCQVVGLLGRGSSGTIYEAIQLSLERPVALKILSDDDATPEQIDELLNEARTVGNILHPNIIKVYNAGIEEGRPFIVMEYLSGQTLQKRLTGESVLLARDALVLAREIALGLQAAHRQGIVHRDLKPSNIFLQRVGRPKIIDFGLAHAFGGQRAALREGGTPEFMAPEQWKFQPTDARTDLYSLGLILYRMLVGRNAFTGDMDSLRHSHLQRPVPIPNPRPAVIGDDLLAIIMKLTRKVPAERYASAEDLIADLDRLDAGKPTRALDDMKTRVTCPICDTENPASRDKCEGCGTILSRVNITTEELLPDAPPPPAPKKRPPPPRRPFGRRR